MAFSRIILVAALAAGAAMPLLAAPPANDNFASRLTLGTGAPSTVSNVDATMEEGTEPFPAGYDGGNYQGTVWWEWSPAISGWHEINTTGSAVDTVLAVWEGTDYTSPLALVHVNDEAPAFDNTAPPVATSRIRFLANNAVIYKIAVASKTAARGSITLNANSTSTPHARVTAATFSPSPANVAYAVTVTADITLQVGSGGLAAGGLLTLFDPSNAELATASVDSSNLLNPPNVSGVYRMLLNLPQGSPVGQCRWGIKMVRGNTAGSVSSAGWEMLTPLPFGVPSAITVINDPYAAWASQNSLSGGDAAKDADPDKDGLKNLAEYECGLDPNNPALRTLIVTGNVITQTGLPEITVVGAGDQLRVVYLRRIADPAVTVTARFSDDLIIWADASQPPEVIASDGEFQALAVEDDIFVPAKTRRNALVRMVSP